MADVGIMFSAPMVRGLLSGAKTQTRRLANSPLARCRPGDRLWVRETWACHWATDNQKPRDIDPDIWSVRYYADDYIRPARRDDSTALIEQCRKKHTAMHMPRWMSRLTLIIEDVRIEPLHSITEKDAEAEGCVWDSADGFDVWYVPAAKLQHTATAVECYRGLWESLHTKEGQRWEENPEVVAISFRVIKRNIDLTNKGDEN